VLVFPRLVNAGNAKLRGRAGATSLTRSGPGGTPRQARPRSRVPLIGEGSQFGHDSDSQDYDYEYEHPHDHHDNPCTPTKKAVGWGITPEQCTACTTGQSWYPCKNCGADGCGELCDGNCSEVAEVAAGCAASNMGRRKGVTDARCELCATGQSWYPCVAGSGLCLGCDAVPGGQHIDLSTSPTTESPTTTSQPTTEPYGLPQTSVSPTKSLSIMEEKEQIMEEEEEMKEEEEEIMEEVGEIKEEEEELEEEEGGPPGQHIDLSTAFETNVAVE